MMTAAKLMRIMPPMMATGKMITKRFLAVGDSPAMCMYNHTVGWQWCKMFLNSGAKSIVCKTCGKFLELHPNAFKPHSFCTNLALKWMLIYKIS